MKKNKSLDLIKEQARFYLSTPERAAEALLYVRNLERFAEELKASVKDRAFKLMEEKNIEVIEYEITDDDGETRKWEVKKDYGRQHKEYLPSKLIEAIGIDKAIKFFKVDKTRTDTFLKRASAKNEITMEQVDTAVSEAKIKYIAGSGVRLREIKNVKDN